MTSILLSNNPNVTTFEINSLFYNLPNDSFTNKREWVDIYKKNVNLFKNEEKNLINSFLSHDFHLNKLFKNYLEEENSENQTIKENIKLIKLQIADSGDIFKGVKILKNKDVRNKINKLEESILKTRQDFKSKFESLLNEEETIEKEILEIQFKVENNGNNNMISHEEIQKDQECQERSSTNNQIVEGPPIQNNFVKDNKQTKGITLDRIIEQVENDKKYFTYIYSNEDIEKYVESFNKPQEIKEIITFLENKIIETGGPTQGWDNKDHQEFLKLRTQHKNKINTLDFISDFENALPYLSRNDLKTHINLFIKFDKYNNIKKIFLEKYKNLKELNDNEKKQNILEKVEKDEKKSKIKMKDFSKNNDEKKKQVDEWKKQKGREVLAQQQVKLEQEQLQKEKEKQKFSEIIEKNKVILEGYYKQKDLEQFEKDLMETPAAQNKKKISEIDLERINERNQALEEKRKLIVKSKSIKLIKESENYKKFQIKKSEKLAKVESKLDYKTAAISQKQRNKHDYQSNKDGCTMANNVLGRMSRAVPEWRKSLV
jgi:hypothetical protein